MVSLEVVNGMTTDKRVIAFGKLLCEMREKKGMPQERLAEMVGIDYSYMINIEREKYFDKYLFKYH